MLNGVWTALITPFDARNELDLGAFRKILRDQRDARVAGVIPCGTTGESPTLTPDEKKTLIHAALEELKGSSVRVIAGTGSNDTRETVALSRWASEQGVAGVLVVTPYYNKPSQAGLEAHFRAVADAVTCEVMAYNVPGRTGVSLTAQTIARLAEHPRITALKEATGNVAFTSEILEALTLSGRRMEILSGDDATYLPLLSVGATGVVSVSSNLFPRAMVAIQEAIQRSDLASAQLVHRKFYPLFRDLFVESNPVPIKHAMAAMDFGDARVRAPLAPLTADSVARLEAAMKACGLERGRPA
jgi:4-hydroxy-tetrahydrodipicolinate synthase